LKNSGDVTPLSSSSRSNSVSSMTVHSPKYNKKIASKENYNNGEDSNNTMENEEIPKLHLNDTKLKRENEDRKLASSSAQRSPKKERKFHKDQRK